MAVPSVIASTKDSPTRANVTPRLRNNAPVLASAIIAVSTMGGGGNLAPPTSSDAIHQVATNRMAESRRITSVSRRRVIERARIKLRRRTDQRGAADFGQHAIENAGIRLLVGSGTMRNALAVTVAVGVQGRAISGAGQR